MNVGDRYGDELVVFEGSQTLPLFLVYTTEFGGGGTSTNNTPAEETGPKGWSFLKQDIWEQFGCLWWFTG